MENVEDLFRRYKNDVYRLAVSYTHSMAEAEDVCQTVFLRLLEQRHITPGKEKAWLMQVTANTCRSLLRSARWKTGEPLDESIPARESGRGEVLDAVMALPPKYRVTVYLHYYEGLTAKEIAALLKLSPSAVTTRLARARELLRQMLSETNDQV